MKISKINYESCFCEHYGGPEILKIVEIEKPIPKENEVLIKVKASTVNAADCNVRGLTYIPPGLGFIARMMLGFKGPKQPIIGTVFAGVIEELGKNVSGYNIGDEVYGTGDEMGAYAEYMCRHTKGGFSLKPKNVSFEEIATIPYGALTALHFLKEVAAVSKGQRVYGEFEFLDLKYNLNEFTQ
jgi:NADPH:quinone reductase-like Zn-dependent oxidoreductase